MSAPQGYAVYPGIEAVVAAEINVTHGITPSVATITMAPQTGFVPEMGALTFWYGQQSVTWYDCKIIDVDFTRTPNGEYWQVHIADRRWKWNGGAIWGRYNIRKDNGDILGYGTTESSEKSPQELASACLNVMGESNYDVSDMPNDLRPEIDWDFVPPAEALAELCDLTGCRVVLGLDNCVRVRRAGYGNQLPTNQVNVLTNSLTGDPPEMPDIVAIVAGRCRYQEDFLLEAVGEDLDGKIKPITELVYRPQEGWESHRGMPLPDFTYIEERGIGMGWSEALRKRARELAQKSVFKWYRIYTPFVLRCLGVTVTNLESILPLETEQVETQLKSDYTPERENKPAWVYGAYCVEDDSEKNSSDYLSSYVVTDTVKYNGGFTIETDTGIVKFSKPVYRNSWPQSFQIAPACLLLRTACCYREPGTRVPLRHVQWRGTGSMAGALPRCVMHEEIVRQLYCNEYSGSVVDNVDEVSQQCEYYIDAILEEYQFRTPQTVRYAGLEYIELDGAIEQVSYSITPQGGTVTTAARNTETINNVVPYKQRRALEKQRETFREMVKLKRSGGAP